jgi:hypothetical protein
LTEIHVPSLYLILIVQIGYEVEFAHELNLRDFPFDTQSFPIEMMLKFEDSAHFAMTLYYVECHKSCMQLNEYSMLAPAAIEQNERQTDLTLNFLRKPTYWMVSFFLPLAALMLCSLLVFLLSAFEMSDRMSLTFTFLLTVVSFRALLGSMLPRLGYFTLLDHYINASTLFAFFVAVASSVVLPLARNFTNQGELDEQLVHSWDTRLLWTCLLIYAALHVRFVVEARRRLQRAVIALPERESWACFQFVDTFFHPLPAPR